MYDVELNSKMYTLHAITGRVVGAEKSSTTEIIGSGGGGGGYSHGGHGSSHTNSVNIRSETTIHDNLFLIDTNGVEHAFKLSDIDVSCRNGNDVTILSMEKKGKGKTKDFAALNHNTRKSHYSYSHLMKPYQNWFTAVLCSIGVYVAIVWLASLFVDPMGVIFFMALALIPAGLFYDYLYKKKPKKQADNFMRSEEFKRITEKIKESYQPDVSLKIEKHLEPS